MTNNGLASKPLATFAEDRKKPAIRVSYWEDLFPVWSLPDQSGRAENTGEAFVKEKLKRFVEAVQSRMVNGPRKTNTRLVSATKKQKN